MAPPRETSGDTASPGDGGLLAPAAPQRPRRTRGSLVGLVMRTVGWCLITTGMLVLLFVAYMLWGTRLETHRAQAKLEKQFERSLAQTRRTSPSPGATPTASSATAPRDVGARFANGEGVARLQIPRIGVDAIVVKGVGREDLKKGPGWMPTTAFPGTPGNVFVAGHRTTYGAEFNRLNELRPGDEITLTTREGRAVYAAAEQRVVAPTEVSVTKPTSDNRLTLSTCNPKFSARQRLLVIAKAVSGVPDRARAAA